MDKVLRARLLDEVDNADAVFAANDCSTYARTRERPIKDHPNAPKPLRSAERPMGLVGLDWKDDQRVETANGLLKLVARIIGLSSKMEGQQRQRIRKTRVYGLASG